MTRSLKEFIARFTIAISFVLTLSIPAAFACNVHHMKEAQLRGNIVELYEIVGTKVERSKNMPKINKKKISFPMVVDDCGDPKFYMWTFNRTDYLIRKSLFLCISSQAARDAANKNKYAGAPGSGETNLTCPTD